MSSTIFDLHGRVALVTGGSKGLGKAIARGFAEAGAEVVISSRHEDELHAAAADIRHGLSTGVATFVADMTHRDDVKRLAESATHAFGRIDILVNNAGTNVPQTLENDSRRRLGSVHRVESYLLHGAVALFDAANERATLGANHFYVVDHGPGLLPWPGRLLGHEKRAARTVPGYRVGVRSLRHHGELHRPGPNCDRSAQKRAHRRAVHGGGESHGAGTLGKSKRTGRPGACLLASQAGDYMTGSIVLVDGGILARTF